MSNLFSDLCERERHMIRKRVSYLLLLGASVVFAGCEKDVDGELITPTVVAGLRYVNLVPDTGGMDIRIIDVVGDAPNTFNATFRTGGQPYGLAITGMPWYTAVLAGTRQIRAFMSSTDPAIATQVMLNLTYDFEANVNYTVYLYGYSRTGQTPSLQAVVTRDDPAAPGTNIAVRVVHLAPTLAPTLTGTSLDVYVDAQAVGVTPTGTPTFATVAPGGAGSYVTMAPGAYRAAAAVTATTTPFIAAVAPAGVAGTSTTDPTPGAGIAGTALSIIVAPPSVAGSSATSFATPGLLFITDRKPPRTAP